MRDCFKKNKTQKKIPHTPWEMRHGCSKAAMVNLHCTSTRVLTLVLPTELETSQETGSVKYE